jgi:transcription initiation factor IIF auxiliary subunit
MQLFRKFYVGNVAEFLPDGSETKTHKWTVYVRPYSGQDLNYIKKVVFSIHTDFENPVRTIDAPGPFEISDVGWGEFDMKVTIHFVDSHEKSLEFPHLLRLFHEGGMRTELEPVISEHLQELVFINPREKMIKALTSPDFVQKPLSVQEIIDAGTSDHLEEEELAKYVKVLEKIERDIEELHQRMEKAIYKEPF